MVNQSCAVPALFRGMDRVHWSSSDMVLESSNSDESVSKVVWEHEATCNLPFNIWKCFMLFVKYRECNSFGIAVGQVVKRAERQCESKWCLKQDKWPSILWQCMASRLYKMTSSDHDDQANRDTTELKGNGGRKVPLGDCLVQALVHSWICWGYAQEQIQLGSGYLQGWRLHSLSEQLLPLLGHNHSNIS